MLVNSDGAATLDAPGSSGEWLNLGDLERLFAELRSEIVSVLRRRTANEDTAADLSQDLFLRLRTIRAPIPNRDHGRAYLRRMASNLAIDHVRSEARRAEIMTGSQVLFEDTDAGPEAWAISRDQLHRVEDALAELPEKCRRVLLLARVHGLTHREIAEQLGVSVSLVEKYQLRALRHCRSRLGSIF